MSDENGDSAAEAGASASPAGGGELEISGDDLSGITDPALASRLETIHRSMSTLGMRIDALVTSTTSYRAALTDRLSEYAELVTKLTRGQANELEEYRRANESVVADLRRGLTTSEETLERIGARIDSMLTDAESTDDSSRRALAEVRSILDAQENLGRFLTESLDRFGEQVVGQLDESEQRAADRLAGIEDRLSVLAGSDPASALAGRFDTLHAALQDLTANLTTDAPDTSDVAPALERVEREVETAGRTASETWSEVAGLKAKVDAVLEATANESGSVSTVLDELKLTLQDLASGEVVGSLWEEFRHLRATVETLVDHSGSTADPEAVEALRTDVIGLTQSVKELLDAADVADTADAPPPVADGTLDQLAADVAALRRELAEGLVVEASGDLASSVDQLRNETAGMAERLARVAEAQADAAEVADTAGSPAVGTSQLDAELRAVRTGVEDIIARLDEGLDLEIDASALLPEADAAPAPSSDGTSELADQLATLRDLVRTEFDAIRHQLGEAGLEGPGAESVDLVALTARLDRLHDDIADQQTLAEEIAAVRDRVGGDEDGAASDGAASDGAASVDLTPVTEALAELQEAMAYLLDRSATPAPEAAAPADTSGGPEFAALDPDTLDLLREEIRASGAPSAELIDTLNAELKALRRRIKLRAEGEIFSDEQLELIADAVAQRLAENS